MNCIDTELVYTCLPEPTTQKIIHGLGCPLWKCVSRKDWNPFPELTPKVVKEPKRIPGVLRPLPDGCESAYELTLTSPTDQPYDLRTALQKICASAMFEIKAWEACIELTAAGLPHIHAVLFSARKYIDGSKIKKLYAHRYECKRVRNLDNYLNYIKKEDGNVNILNYCNAKAIPQFWQCPV